MSETPKVVNPGRIVTQNSDLLKLLRDRTEEALRQNSNIVSRTNNYNSPVKSHGRKASISRTEYSTVGIPRGSDVFSVVNPALLRAVGIKPTAEQEANFDLYTPRRNQVNTEFSLHDTNDRFNLIPNQTLADVNNNSSLDKTYNNYLSNNLDHYPTPSYPDDRPIERREISPQDVGNGHLGLHLDLEEPLTPLEKNSRHNLSNPDVAESQSWFKLEDSESPKRLVSQNRELNQSNPHSQNNSQSKGTAPHSGIEPIRANSQNKGSHSRYNNSPNHRIHDTQQKSRIDSKRKENIQDHQRKGNTEPSVENASHVTMTRENLNRVYIDSPTFTKAEEDEYRFVSSRIDVYQENEETYRNLEKNMATNPSSVSPNKSKINRRVHYKESPDYEEAERYDDEINDRERSTQPRKNNSRQYVLRPSEQSRSAENKSSELTLAPQRLPEKAPGLGHRLPTGPTYDPDDENELDQETNYQVSLITRIGENTKKVSDLKIPKLTLPTDSDEEFVRDSLDDNDETPKNNFAMDSLDLYNEPDESTPTGPQYQHQTLLQKNQQNGRKYENSYDHRNEQPETGDYDEQDYHQQVQSIPQRHLNPQPRYQNTQQESYNDQAQQNQQQQHVNNLQEHPEYFNSQVKPYMQREPLIPHARSHFNSGSPAQWNGSLAKQQSQAQPKGNRPLVVQKPYSRHDERESHGSHHAPSAELYYESSPQMRHGMQNQGHHPVERPAHGKYYEQGHPPEHHQREPYIYQGESNPPSRNPYNAYPEQPYEDHGFQNDYYVIDTSDAYTEEETLSPEKMISEPIKQRIDFVENNRKDYGRVTRKTYKQIQAIKKEEGARLENVFIKPKIKSRKKQSNSAPVSNIKTDIRYASSPQLYEKPSTSEEIWMQKSNNLSYQKEPRKKGKLTKYPSDGGLPIINKTQGQPPEQRSGVPSNVYNQGSPEHKTLTLQPISRDFLTEDGQRISVDVNLKLLSPPQSGRNNWLAEQAGLENYGHNPHGMPYMMNPHLTGYDGHQPSSQQDYPGYEQAYQEGYPSSRNYESAPEYLDYTRPEHLPEGRAVTSSYKVIPPIQSTESSPTKAPINPDDSYVVQYRKQKEKKTEEPWYKIYNLKDYRKMQKEIQLGSLGPDLDNTSYKERIEKFQRQNDYARMVNERNKKQAVQSRRPPSYPRKQDKQEDDIMNRRRLAVEYAKTIPKPVVKSKPSGYNSYEVSGQIPLGGKLSDSPKSKEIDMIDLENLQQRHERDKQNVAVIQQNLELQKA